MKQLFLRKSEGNTESEWGYYVFFLFLRVLFLKHFSCAVSVQDYKHLAGFVKIFHCEQKITILDILKLFRFAKSKLISFFSNGNACALFMNGSVPRLFVLTSGISH